MIELKAQVIGAEAVRVDLEKQGEGAPARVRGAVQQLGLELLRRVKETKLTGQVLRVQTGRLRRSINERTEVRGTDITSSVGTNVGYGRFWELGFHGVETVRAHTRRTSKAEALVREHQRRVNQAARPFLQPSLAEMVPRVREKLSEVALGA